MSALAALGIPPIGWVVLGLSALVVGIAKASIGGVAALSVAGFALFIPTRESTAAVLILLLVGDVVAVTLYRRSADLAMLRRLLPSVLPGIVLGALLYAEWNPLTAAGFVWDTASVLVVAEGALAVARWVRALRPGGRLVLVEGDWSTGAGLTAPRCAEIVSRSCTQVEVRHLPDPALWGREISDVRYLVLARP